jgi:predicted nucleic acid-binding protein
MAPRFLDTNILLRYLTRDDEAKAEAALAILLRVERGEERVVTSPMVVFETVFTLERSYRVERSLIKDRVEAIIRMRGLQLASKQLYYRALELYVAHNISFADAFNAALLKTRGLSEIYSWDEDFDHMEGITRIDPVLL